MPRILVVEDNSDVADALCHLLEVEGFAATWAPSGERALEVLRASPAGFGLILLDVMMPGMDGWQFRERQVSESQLASIPVVLLTANQAAFRKAESTGGVAVLLKPVNVDELLDVVRRHLPG